MLSQHPWSEDLTTLFHSVHSQAEGLSSREALRRRNLTQQGHLRRKQHLQTLRLLAAQFLTPINALLLFTVSLSFSLGDGLDATILFGIVSISASLGFWQEYSASKAMETLLALVRVEALVLRDGQPVKIPVEHVVAGDVVLLSAGAKIPADCRLIEARDLFVNEASLTGETFPVEKKTESLALDTIFAQRCNLVYLGTHVVSGTGRALVLRQDADTEYHRIAARLRLRPPETEFERGIRHFGVFLFQLTLVMMLGIFAINLYFARPWLDAFLFALALAVGLTPQLLPAIISVNLSHGARLMARQGVIVRRLAAIENFGSMDVLCSDKTGTLTEGKVVLKATLDGAGVDFPKAAYLAAINAHLESGFVNPIDQAIRLQQTIDLSLVKKLDEIPYDFIRKRLSVLVEVKGERLLVTKGALTQILDICQHIECADGSRNPLSEWRSKVVSTTEAMQARGFRVLAIASKPWFQATAVEKHDETDMTLVGLLVFEDPLKPKIPETLAALKRQGITLKIISGDSIGVVRELGRQVFGQELALLSGRELSLMSDEALLHRVSHTDLYAEVEPNQKERLILSLKKAGHVVGYMGDGINDASALHVADVGISVDQAVDVAKEAADIVLLQRDLAVLAEGVRYGRSTFANTLKYVFMASSANFGNMFSMAGASLFLPFLPLLPKQILLTNLLTDLPEMTIATDRVEEEQILIPRRWDIALIRRFMLVFGGLSSVFDYLSFGVLLYLVPQNTEQFRAAWFIESVSSAALVVLVIRSPRPLGQSMPGRALLSASIAAIALATALPWTPWASYLGFAPPTWPVLACILAILVMYATSAEFLKRGFHQGSDARPPRQKV